MNLKNFAILSGTFLLSGSLVSCGGTRDAKLIINAPNYVYVGKEIDKSKINAYELVNGKITKVDSSNLELSRTKFDKKGDGEYMINVTSKSTGNVGCYPITVLESHEVNEEAFVDAFDDIENDDMEVTGNIISNSKYKRIDRSSGEEEETETFKFIRNGEKEYADRSLKTVESIEGEEKRESSVFTANGYIKSYDSKSGRNIYYSMPGEVDQSTGDLKYLINYQLPRGNFTETRYSSFLSDYIYYNGGADEFKLNDNKQYVYDYSSQFQTATKTIHEEITFENGKILKYSLKRNSKSTYTEDSYTSSYVINRKQTTDPIKGKEIKQLNYQYVATDLTNGVFAKTIQTGTDSFNFHLKFYEDYNSETSSYEGEVNEGFFVNEDFFKFEPLTSGFTVAFDDSKKFNVVVNPPSGGWTVGSYPFLVSIPDQKLNKNIFARYINGLDFCKNSIVFVITVQ